MDKLELVETLEKPLTQSRRIEATLESRVPWTSLLNNNTSNEIENIMGSPPSTIETIDISGSAAKLSFMLVSEYIDSVIASLKTIMQSCCWNVTAPRTFQWIASKIYPRDASDKLLVEAPVNLEGIKVIPSWEWLYLWITAYMVPFETKIYAMNNLFSVNASTFKCIDDLVAFVNDQRHVLVNIVMNDMGFKMYIMHMLPIVLQNIMLLTYSSLSWYTVPWDEFVMVLRCYDNIYRKCRKTIPRNCQYRDYAKGRRLWICHMSRDLFDDLTARKLCHLCLDNTHSILSCPRRSSLFESGFYYFYDPKESCASSGCCPATPTESNVGSLS